MKKIIYTLASLLAISSAMPIGAKEISQEDAMKIAQQFVVSTLGTTKGATAPLRLIHTVAANEGNALYVFAPANGEGFTLVAGNDVMAPVFGYSETGKFDAANIPENLAFWLNVYRNNVDALVAQGAPSYATKFPDDTKPNVDMIMKTTWDQDAPYYNLCPKSGSRYTYTGCVATAMAQVMKVFECPTKSTGKATWNNTLVTFDRTYSWDKMLNSYSGSYTTAQGTAVAELMVDCGKSVDMSYSTSGSGANTDVVPPALINNFGYNVGAAYIQKSAFSPQSWNDLMYNEVSHGRPILYGGFGAGYDGGHQFVADGYRTTGYYHINWGWSGLCDGYYLIDDLTPSQTGIGGGSYGSYNVGCDAVIFIRPAASTTNTWEDRGVFCTGNFNISTATATSATFNCTNGSFWSYNWTGFALFGGNSFSATLGVRFINVDDPTKSVTLGAASATNFTKWSTLASSYKVNISTLPDGKYYAFPMSKASDMNTWTRMYQHTDKRQYMVVTKANGAVTYTAGPTDATQFYPVSWIIVDKENEEIDAGKTFELTPLVLPAGANNRTLSYISSAPDVAKVDAQGVVTGVKQGTAVITIAATDGSGIETKVNVKVIPGVGVETVELSAEKLYDVYNMMGIRVATQLNVDEINHLPRGIYIVGGKKIVVK